MHELLRRVAVLPWNSSVAERYGRVRAGLQSGGRTLGPLDLWIAARALAVGAVWVTSDMAESAVAGRRSPRQGSGDRGLEDREAELEDLSVPRYDCTFAQFGRAQSDPALRPESMTYSWTTP